MMRFARGMTSDRQLMGAVALVVVWLALLQLTHPGYIEESDEVNYTQQALMFADRGTLETGSYYYKALLVQDPPLNQVHTPGYSIALGSFLWITGTDGDRLAAHQTIPSFLNYLLLAAVALSLFVVLRRRCRSVWIPWLALAAFATSPLINQYGTMVMAEVTVIAILMAVLLLTLGTSENPTPSNTAVVIAGVLLAFGVLIRPSFVLMLPVVAFLLWRSAGWRTALLFGGVVVALMPVVGALSEGRLRAPGSTLRNTLDAMASGPVAGARAVYNNLTQNLEAFFTSFKGYRYAANKVMFWMLAAAMVATIVSPRIRRLPIAWAAIVGFIINTIALFTTYDVFAWRGLRVSIQFVPLAILLLALAADGLGERRRQQALIGFGVLIFAGLAVTGATILDRTDKVERTAKKDATVMALTELCFEGDDPAEVVLLHRNAQRIRVDHSDVTWVLPTRRHKVTDKKFSIVDQKMEFDCIVGSSKWLASFDEFEEIGSTKTGRYTVYRRIEPGG